VAPVHGRAGAGEGLFNKFNSARDAGAKAAWAGEADFGGCHETEKKLFYNEFT
jgi:hypothetical protein